MSALAVVTREDLLADQLLRASRKLREMERIEREFPLEATPEWCLALREYNDALDFARDHAMSMRNAGFIFAPWVEQLMKSHGV